MKNKKLMLGVIYVFSLLMVMGIVSATPQLTLNTLTWQDGTKVNISTKSANDGSLVNMTFITLYTSAANTPNSSSSRVINITNTTATNFDLGYANFTFDTSLVLFDATTHSVTGTTTGVGDSGGVALSATTVTIDRGKPTSSLLTPSDDTRYESDTQRRSIAFTATCTNATSATLFIDTFAHTMTESSDVCSYTKDYLDDQIHNWYVRSSDGTNTTDSTTFQLEITTPGGGSNSDYSAPTGAGASGTGVGTQSVAGGTSGGGATGGFGKFAILAIAAYFIFQQGGSSKKGSRKR